MNDYYKVSEAENYVFYKVPKALFTEDKYFSISTDAKMLYGLLLDRMHLSVKNGWADKSRRVYQFFTAGKAAFRTRKDLQTVLGIRAGGFNPAETARAGQAKYYLSEKVLTSGFRISKVPNIRG